MVQHPSSPQPDQAESPGGSLSHRIAEVRSAQNISLRTVSRRCGLPVKQLRIQERGGCELTLSELQRWAAALEVPIVELLQEPSEDLTAAVSLRAQLIRLMKTVQALRAHADSNSTRRLADQLRQQLLVIMPELEDVTAWPREGGRSRSGHVPRIIELPIAIDPLDLTRDPF